MAKVSGSGVREELLFVNKKKQKNFALLGLGVWPGHRHTDGPEEQSFLVLFFTKERLVELQSFLQIFVLKK
jgi:hypothetical protein